jgi:hypothetical protein
MEALIDQILFWLVANCQSTGFTRFCEKSTGSMCIHAQTLFNCLQVSKEFLPVGARYLWSKYATLPDLLRLVSVDVHLELEEEDSNGCVSHS